MRLTAIDFLSESAKYMAKVRPELYSQETAVAELDAAMNHLREADMPFSCCSFASFVLCRVMDEDVEEFILTLKVSGMLLSESEEEVIVYGWNDGVNLPPVTGMLDDEDED